MVDRVQQTNLCICLLHGGAFRESASVLSLCLFDRVAFFATDFANCVGHFFEYIYILYRDIIYTIETGRTMFLHSVVIGIVAYLFMIYALGQSQMVAENRSFLLGAVVLAYMIMFGHGLPTSVNKGLF